ncbi:MAG: purine-binding chemotaxis protein CheW [Candidatus Krumholzibacteriota bacterium]|nr:purine-binding chemotaxis protein CheW [Candidatus Krumholzibacteriota bacterium]
MDAENITKKDDAGIQLVTFRLGNEGYGVPVDKVKEIIRPIDAFPIPGMAGPVEGVINLRGEIIPVLRIHAVLGVKGGMEETNQRKRRIIILDTEGGGFGFVVDEVMDVVRVDGESIKSSPEVSSDHTCDEAMIGIVQVAGRMIICLDPGKLVIECIKVKDLVGDCVKSGM